MKFSLVFLLFVVLNVRGLLLKRSQNELSIAFEDVTNFIRKLNNEVTIMNFANTRDLFDGVLLRSLKASSIPVSIISEIKIENYKGIIEKSTILFFDSVNDLKKFNRIMKTNEKFPKSFKLFIYCDKATIKQFSKIGKPKLKERNDEDRGYLFKKNDMKVPEENEDDCSYDSNLEKAEESDEEDCKFFMILGTLDSKHRTLEILLGCPDFLKSKFSKFPEGFVWKFLKISNF
jgi:hypothetical protein